MNKAKTGNLSYVIGEGENRWDCRIDEETDRDLKKFWVKVEDVTVHCLDVRGECYAVYKLKSGIWH